MVDFKRSATTADRLRQALADSKMTQADLVRKTGIYRGTISNYFNGKYEPKSGAINKLALALNVSEAWLWGYDVPKERSEKKNNPTSEGGEMSSNRKLLMQMVDEIPEEALTEETVALLKQAMILLAKRPR